MLGAILGAMAGADTASAQLTDHGAWPISQGDTSSGAATETGDEFGGALAVGDFDRDGFDDLAVGSPGETVGGWSDSGAVLILYGWAGGASITDTRVFTRDSAGLPGSADQHGDRFGAALAVGDFDGDDYVDLAIGAPGFSFTSAIQDEVSAGAVFVLWGGSAGLTTNGSLMFTQTTLASNGLSEQAEIDDRCGTALAAAHRSGIDRDWLWVGCPGEDLYVGSGDHGIVFWIDLDGRSAGNPEYVSQDTDGVDGTAEDSDEFGSSLVAADFSGNGEDDVAIGVPFEDVGDVSNCGFVNVIYGNSATYDFTDVDGWSPDTTNVQGACNAGDHFGNALTAGDFDDDGFPDLAVGIEQDEVDSVDDAGAVTILFGSGSRLTARDQIVSQSGTIAGSVEGGDEFGHALAAGDFDGDGADDLAVGVWTEDVDPGGGEVDAAGAVNVVYGLADSGLTTTGNQIFDQSNPPLMPDHPETADHFGSAVAVGDFDGNGFADLAIGAPDENVITGKTNEGQITVVYSTDPATGAFGAVDFTDPASITVNEGDTVTLHVVRTGGAPVFGSIDVVGRFGSATPDDDYTGLPKTLVWDVGELGTKTVTVTIVDDAIAELQESRTIELMNASADLYEAGALVTIYIDDHDPGPLFSDGFESGNTSHWTN